MRALAIAADTSPIRSGLHLLRLRRPDIATAVSGANPLDEFDTAELPGTKEMTQTRLEEFAAGRSAAREALRQAGHAQPVVGSDDGLPVFPEGYVGSIAHKHGRAVAACTRASVASGIGIDLEFDDERAEADLRATVVAQGEADTLRKLAEAKPNLRSPATLLLCAKEAIYKAVFPLRRVKFDFEDLEVSLNVNRGSFRALRFPASEGLLVTGHYANTGGWIICVAAAKSGRI